MQDFDAFSLTGKGIGVSCFRRLPQLAHAMLKNIGIFLCSVGMPLGLVMLIAFLDDGASGGSGAGIVAWFGHIWFLLVALVGSFIVMVRAGNRCNPDREEPFRLHFSTWEKVVLSNAVACVVVLLFVLRG